MGNKHPKDATKNLDPVHTHEEAVARGRNGGIKSGIAKREKKLMSKIYGDYLAKQANLKTIEEVIAMVLSNAGEKGGGAAAVSMLREMRETLEGSKVSATIENDFEGLSDEQLISRAKELAKIANGK